MTGGTHRKYAILFSLVVLMVIYKMGLSRINYYIALVLVVEFSKFGALFPDIDHEWKNVKYKNVITLILNKLIHLTGGKHRSRHTHSLDITIISCYLLYNLSGYLYRHRYIDIINKEIVYLMCVGFISGWISHIFSDMLTSAGVYVSVLCGRKVAFVPKGIWKLRFNTGNEWEWFNNKLIGFINFILLILALIYPYIKLDIGWGVILI
ncbi:MAG: metal-dependent hydrolase [Candidatus Anstonellales archaeon]